METKDLHIALPAYNEGAVLRSVLEELRAHGFNNIIIIDDGSTDSTRLVAQEQGVTVISHLQNRGAGAASQTAIEFARNKDIKFLLLMDADGQHHSKDIQLLYETIQRTDHDIIIGNRFSLESNKIPRPIVADNAAHNA